MLTLVLSKAEVCERASEACPERRLESQVEGMPYSSTKNPAIRC